jgi:hypothetical protein
MTPLTPIQMVFGLFQSFLMFIFMFAMPYHVNNKVIYFLLIEIWECALSYFIVQLVCKDMLDICHVHDLGATYPKHVFSLIPMCNDSQLIWNLHGTQTQHVLNIYHWNFSLDNVLVGVSPCEGAHLWHHFLKHNIAHVHFSLCGPSKYNNGMLKKLHRVTQI